MAPAIHLASLLYARIYPPNLDNLGNPIPKPPTTRLSAAYRAHNSDVISIILRYLPRTDRATCMRVSKLFYDLTSITLYRNVSITSKRFLSLFIGAASHPIAMPPTISVSSDTITPKSTLHQPNDNLKLALLSEIRCLELVPHGNCQQADVVAGTEMLESVQTLRTSTSLSYDLGHHDCALSTNLRPSEIVFTVSPWSKPPYKPFKAVCDSVLNYPDLFESVKRIIIELDATRRVNLTLPMISDMQLVIKRHEQVHLVFRPRPSFSGLWEMGYEAYIHLTITELASSDYTLQAYLLPSIPRKQADRQAECNLRSRILRWVEDTLEKKHGKKVPKVVIGGYCEYKAAKLGYTEYDGEPQGSLEIYSDQTLKA